MIAAAIAIWKRKSHPDHRCQGWGASHDWTKTPTVARAWTPKDFDKYQAWFPASTGRTRWNTVGITDPDVERSLYREACSA